MSYKSYKKWIFPTTSLLSVIILILFLVLPGINTIDIGESVERQNLLFRIFILMYIMSYPYLIVSSLLGLYGLIWKNMDVDVECRRLTNAGVSLLCIGMLLQMIWSKFVVGSFIIDNRIFLMSLIEMCIYVIYLHIRTDRIMNTLWLLLIGGGLLTVLLFILF